MYLSQLKSGFCLFSRIYLNYIYLCLFSVPILSSFFFMSFGLNKQKDGDDKKRP